MPRGCRGCAPGKLTALAKAWASGRGGGVVRTEDAATANAELPTWMTRRIAEPDLVEIAAIDADTAALFLSLDTQWRRDPMTGRPIGLDYAAIGPTAQLFGLTCPPAAARDLRSMELAALAELAKAARRR